MIKKTVKFGTFDLNSDCIVSLLFLLSVKACLVLLHDLKPYSCTVLPVSISYSQCKCYRHRAKGILISLGYFSILFKDIWELYSHQPVSDRTNVSHFRR